MSKSFQYIRFHYTFSLCAAYKKHMKLTHYKVLSVSKYLSNVRFLLLLTMNMSGTSTVQY